MIKKKEAFGGFSVDNLQKAKHFYEDTLGFVVTESPMGTLELHLEGNNPLVIYPKDNHLPATFTILNFPVDNLDKTIDDLSKKGIEFEHYDGEIAADKKGIHRDGGFAIAWFKDPAGNILSLIEDSKS